MSRKFKSSPTSKDVILLESVQFQCQPPGGNPPPTVKWRKDSVDVQTSERVKTEVIGAIYYLFINKVIQQDAGNYSCVASNEAGERFTDPSFLRVLGMYGY